MKKTFLFVATAMTIFSSCHNLSTKIHNLMALRGKIEEKYKVKDVGININSENGKSYLKVSLVNTSYNDSSETAKQNIADSIGALCAANLPEMKFAGGDVSFAQQTNLGVVKTKTSNSYDMHLGH